MSDIYLRSSDGLNSDSGLTWALAKANLADALTAAGAGGRVFMSKSHAEFTSGAITLASPGTKPAPVTIICVDDVGDPEPPIAVATTGVVETASGSINNITLTGSAYSYGVSYKIGDDLKLSTNLADITWVIEKGLLDFTRNTEAVFAIGSQDGDVSLLLKDVDYQAAGTASSLSVSRGGRLIWDGGTLLTNIIDVIDLGNRAGSATIKNVDLSICSGVGVDTSRVESWTDILFERCKINPLFTLVSGPLPSARTSRIRMHSCSSLNTTYEIREEAFEGALIDETTIIRTGGASDGTTGISLKMVSNGNAVNQIQALVSLPIMVWTDSTASTTFTVEIVHDSLVNLKNDEVWLELEYPGTTTLGLTATGKVSDLLAAPSDQSVSTEAWTTTGMTNPNKQKLSVTATPGKAGQVTIRVYLAKPSTTIYVDLMVVES